MSLKRYFQIPLINYKNRAPGEKPNKPPYQERNLIITYPRAKGQLPIFYQVIQLRPYSHEDLVNIDYGVLRGSVLAGRGHILHSEFILS